MRGRLLFLMAGLLASLTYAGAAQAQAVNCAAMRDPVHLLINPTNGTNLLTVSAHEANQAGDQGFTLRRGTPIKAGRKPGHGLIAVHRLINHGSGDYIWLTNQNEIRNAVLNLGYTDYGAGFHASPTAQECTAPVWRYKKGNKHRHAFSEADRAALLADGWTYETVSFHARLMPQPPDTQFSFAVIPDTQNEVFNGTPRTRHLGRANWLVSNRDALDLRWVLHSGDITNWGERDEPQYVVASEGVAPLEQAGIPVAYTPGNHDTRAVCQGGGACPGESASVNVRFMPLFSQYFNERFAVSGRMEPGKIDNYYALFEAGGVNWMVLSLELWPRTTAIDWAKGVVAAHPNHNVIVVTHMHLNGDGSISTSNGGYGANSPMFLYQQLISQYANIRFVFSGHVGSAAYRVDTGVHGNKIASFLQAFHSQSNPVRIVEIDTQTDEVSTWIYAPHTQQQFPEHDAVIGGMGFVRPPLGAPGVIRFPTRITPVPGKR